MKSGAIEPITNPEKLRPVLRSGKTAIGWESGIGMGVSITKGTFQWSRNIIDPNSLSQSRQKIENDVY